MGDRRIIEPHVGQVLVVHPGGTGIRQARAKTDRLDARALAKLLAVGSLDGALDARLRQTRAVSLAYGEARVLSRTCAVVATWDGATPEDRAASARPLCGLHGWR